MGSLMQSNLLDFTDRVGVPEDVFRLRERLFQLLSRGYENPYNLTGTVLVKITDCPRLNFQVNFHPEHFLVSDAESINVDAEFILNVRMIAQITDVTGFDWHDQSPVSTIEAKGRLDLVEHLGSCLLQPHPNTISRYLNAQKKHFSRGFRMANAIEKLVNLTHQKILMKMDWGFPFVMRCPSPCVYTQKWTTQRLLQYFGDIPVRFFSGGHLFTLREFLLGKSLGYQEERLAIFSISRHYIEGTELAGSMKDAFGPIFFQRDDFLEPKLWLGSIDADVLQTSLRRNPQTHFFYQLMGFKRVTFYSADQSIYLYPRKAHNKHQSCWFRPNSPDYEQMPEARKANSFTVVVQPGDILVIPFGWFYQTRLDSSPNLSISYSWKH